MPCLKYPSFVLYFPAFTFIFIDRINSKAVLSKKPSSFQFKKFSVQHDRSTHKVGTDGVLLGAWVNTEGCHSILDVGTGSGVIALMMAQRTPPDTRIDAIDINPNDAEQARENVLHSPWPEKIIVHHVRLQEFESHPADLIVSNPPFFKNSAKPPSASRSQARHTDTLSQEELLTHGNRLLAPSGRLAVVLPDAEGRKFVQLAESNGWYCARMCFFHSRESKPAERVLLELTREQKPLHHEKLVLYKGESLVWTDAYRALTGNFYL